MFLVQSTKAAPLANDADWEYYYGCDAETKSSQMQSTASSRSLMPSAGSFTPVLSTMRPDTSSYSLSTTGRLTSLSSSAIQSASSTVEPQTSGVRCSFSQLPGIKTLLEEEGAK
ncbi:unnamed protein product [Aureobasidium mustum]|uniref:Uncharacterized protein n=1 Tax=Aureobasidium mustum TaxID=2773714 RepID=A0A9N8K6P6_9PEZI|nr:unnamed protein product [Aureobasidium mustum]